MIEGEVARGLEHERLEVLDGPFAQGAGHPQVGLLQQVFGSTGVIHHALQRTQQADPLREENGVELGLTHSGTRPWRGE
ncbi:hypothetical protein D3C76_1703630 [compost metagenome]